MLILGFMLAASAACGGRSNQTSEQGAPAPAPASAVAPLPHGTVSEDLTFTGDVGGRMETARHGNAFTCGGLGAMYIVDPILGAIGGKSYELGMRITGFKGPGSYKTGGELTPGSGVAAISIWLKPGNTQDVSYSKSGSITVDDDKRSGTMDADLAGKLGTFHVAGHWQCPPDF